MYEFCHRCHAELPQVRSDVSGRGGASLADEALLFCPHCSAPQILLPDHLLQALESAPATTGTPPPPRLHAQQIDWPLALRAGAVVAAVGAILAVAMLKSQFFGFLSTVWVISSGATAIAIYLRQKPTGTINTRAGWKIGLAAGLLLVAARGVALSTSGVIARFSLHSMTQFDNDMAAGSKENQDRVLAWMTEQNAGKDMEDRYVSLMSSPEVRAGSILFGLGFQSVLLLLAAGGSGAFAGAVRARRPLND